MLKCGSRAIFMRINKLTVKNVLTYLYVVGIFLVMALLITEMIKHA